MEKAINSLALFYKVGSSIKNFREKKIRILVKRDIILTLHREEVR